MEKDDLMHWSIPRNHPTIIKCHAHTFNIVRKIFNLFNDGKTMCFFDAWLPDPPTRVQEAMDWINRSAENKALFLIGFDPAEGLRREIPEHDRIIILDYPNFSLFTLVCNKYFKKYSLEELYPKTFQNLFLCYQNKISPERISLYYELKSLPGIVTITGKNFSHINKNVDDREQRYYYYDLNTLPNDILTLGNMDVWNSSFLNIVSETVGEMHVTEKTFKPFIGMRPFVTFSHDVEKYFNVLNTLGFENFNEELGFEVKTKGSFFERTEDIRRVVENLQKDNVDDLYKKLYPKLLHNHHNVEKAAKKIEEYIKSYQIRRLH